MKNIITHTSWKSKDLIKICAYLNTNGGEITYIVKEEDNSVCEKLIKLIHQKLKKIHPDVSKLVDITFEEKVDYKEVKVFVKISPVACFVLSRSGEKSYYYINGDVVVKTSEELVKRYKEGTSIKKSITKLTSILKLPDTVFVDNYTFISCNTVPIYEAFSVYGFNRIVGYLKHVNRTFANVYSRGQCELYDSLIPSLYRNKNNLENEDNKIDIIVNRFMKDSKMIDSLALDIIDKKRSKYRIEGVLQHYGATTSFLDVVDNHWIALWMGLNTFNVKEQIEKYAQYVERAIPLIEKISGGIELQDEKKWEKKIYQYVLLIAVPFSKNQVVDGINITKEIIEIDLRKSLPSTFLRPHAQHGLVIKRNVQNTTRKAEDYDLSKNVVAIIRVRIDRAKQWIGNGELLTQDNLIPPPGYDPGYDLLLSRKDLFRKSSLKITKYM
jgi:hypothetical protein